MLCTLFIPIRLSELFFRQNSGSPPHPQTDRREVHCRKVVVDSSVDQYPIPLVVYIPRDIDRPCRTLLVGYGAYGVSVPTQYDSQISTYLHRGWIVAFAGTRGGGELGKLHHQR